MQKIREAVHLTGGTVKRLVTKRRGINSRPARTEHHKYIKIVHHPVWEKQADSKLKKQSMVV